MSEIYEKDKRYNFGKHIVLFVYKRFYDEYIVLGKENIKGSFTRKVGSARTGVKIDRTTEIPCYIHVTATIPGNTLRKNIRSKTGK